MERPMERDDERNDERELAEVEARLRGVRETAPRSLDRRVEALLASGDVVRERWSARRWIAAAAGIAALALVGYAADALWREPSGERRVEPPLVAQPAGSRDRRASEADEPLPVAVTAERSDLPRSAPAPTAKPAATLPDDDDWDPPEPRARYSGVPRNLDARETFRRAPFVARLKCVGDRDGIARDGRSFSRPIATIEHVYHGDRSLKGARVEIHRQVEPATERSFLCWGDESFDERRGGEVSPFDVIHRGVPPLVTCFALIDKAPLADGTLHAQQLFADSWGGTWLTDGLPDRGEPPTDVEGEIAALLSDLVTGLESHDRRVDTSIVVALRRFDGGQEPGATRPSRVWNDGAARAALLREGRNRHARVRWNVAWMDPSLAGSDGYDLLHELAFDEDSLVRSVAVHQLAKSDPAVAELQARRNAIADASFDELLSLVPIRTRVLLDDDGLARRLEELRAPAPREARVSDLLDLQHVKPVAAVETLRGFLRDPDSEVRRTAAFVLATAGDDAAASAALREVREDEEPGVQALAGYAQLERRDARGFDRLHRLLDSDDARGRERAVRMVARAIRGSGAELAAPLLLDACRNADPLVRCEALVALARLGTPRVHELYRDAGVVAEALAKGESDESGIVRAAVASSAVKGARVLDEREVETLRALGYADGESDDDR